MITQDRPDFDRQGYLQKYCWPCMRNGPEQWDYAVNDWKSDFRNMMIHPSELGHDKADDPETKGACEKRKRE